MLHDHFRLLAPFGVMMEPKVLQRELIFTQLGRCYSHCWCLKEPYVNPVHSIQYSPACVRLSALLDHKEQHHHLSFTQLSDVVSNGLMLDSAGTHHDGT